MDEDDQYSLHYESSNAIIESDQKSVASLMKNTLQCENPFDTKETNKCKTSFWMSHLWARLSEINFMNSIRKKKILHLFDMISKTW